VAARKIIFAETLFRDQQPAEFLAVSFVVGIDNFPAG
jgi:hypothetical protein